MIPLRDDNPSTSRPLVTYVIIAICVAVFLYMVSLGSENQVERFIFKYGAIPGEVTGSGGANAAEEYPTLITSMFMHGGWFHLGGNMLYLWIFGDNVEDLMGHVGFLIFYLLTGIAAVMTHILLSPNSRVPLIGASGAIAGVLGAYLVLFPRARILSLLPFGLFSRFVHVPAIYFLPIWFVLQLISGLGSIGAEESAGVAWWAHVGGFVAGILLVFVFARRRRTVGWQ
ncbi:MAG TPA: rhomboid family intramembrane serine protease [bacterium]|nr:rhomboid family intramembrane serine protease [bacterium]